MGYTVTIFVPFFISGLFVFRAGIALLIFRTVVGVVTTLSDIFIALLPVLDTPGLVNIVARLIQQLSFELFKLVQEGIERVLVLALSISLSDELENSMRAQFAGCVMTLGSLV